MAKKYCPNCHHPLPYKAKFCAYCGQKNQDGKVPVGDLVQQVWFKVFHLESRYFTAIFRLLIPGQVSIDYFSGKRKRYPPPVQLFFVVMFFFLFIATHTEWNGGQSGVRVRTSSDSGEAPPASPEAPQPQQRAEASDVFKALEKAYQVRRIRLQIDSLSPQYHTRAFRRGVDTLLQRTLMADSLVMLMLKTTSDETADSSGASNDIDTFNLSLGLKTYHFATQDVFTRSPDDLLDTYHVDRWVERLFVKQALKVMRDPESLLHKYLGSLAWTLFVGVILGAGILMLLYARRRRYYVEHLIFLLHLNSGYGLLLTAGLLLTWPGWLKLGNVILATLAWTVLSSWVAIYRYYRQKALITTFKWGVFGFFYLLITALTFVGSLAVVLALF